MRTKKKVIKKISLDVFLSVQDLMPDYGLKPLSARSSLHRES